METDPLFSWIAGTLLPHDGIHYHSNINLTLWNIIPHHHMWGKCFGWWYYQRLKLRGFHGNALRLYTGANGSFIGGDLRYRRSRLTTGTSAAFNSRRSPGWRHNHDKQGFPDWGGGASGKWALGAQFLPLPHYLFLTHPPHPFGVKIGPLENLMGLWEGIGVCKITC